MAKVRQSECAAGEDYSTFLPKQRYRARVIGTTYKEKNNSGNPMTTLTCEIITDSVEVNGELVPCAGRQFSLFLFHDPRDPKSQQVYTLCKKLGIELPQEPDSMGVMTGVYDTDLHKEYFLGMEFDIILSTSEEIARQERKPGQKQGDPILDGEGNQIKAGWRINFVNLDRDIPEYCQPEKNEEIAANRAPFLYE